MRTKKVKLIDWENKLKAIKKKGFIKTHRSGPTGIGKTLEDLMSIKENNIAEPDGGNIELKSARKPQTSMLTLFTKSPLPKGVNSLLLKRFGYAAKKGKLRLETSVKFGEFNKLKGEDGFKIEIDKTAKRINLVASNGEIVAYWDKDTVEQHFKKAEKVLYVLADTKKNGKKEELFFNEALLLSGFSFDRFIELIKAGSIIIDIRIGQYTDGRPHDHGTGFRIKPNNLSECFSKRNKIF